MILGIDPGLKGAIAGIGNRGNLVGVVDMPVIDKWPDTLALRQLLDDPGYLDRRLAVVEKVRSMPGQGVASTFKFGASWGMVLQAVAGWPLEEPTPAKWKRDMGLTKDKDAARAMARRLWPDDGELFARVKDDGRAEAALLAEWGRRLLVERGQL